MNSEQLHELMAERALADDLAAVLDVPPGGTNTPEWFNERRRVLARYREARR